MLDYLDVVPKGIKIKWAGHSCDTFRVDLLFVI